MKINATNYEEWAMDYIEGTISPEIRISFEQFLSENPEIARDIWELREQMPLLAVDEVVYPGKQALLRSGRTMRLGRLSSLLCGAAAASMLIGVFIALNLFSDRNAELLSQRPNQTPVASEFETLPNKADVAAEIALLDTETLSDAETEQTTPAVNAGKGRVANRNTVEERVVKGNTAGECAAADAPVRGPVAGKKTAKTTLRSMSPTTGVTPGVASAAPVTLLTQDTQNAQGSPEISIAERESAILSDGITKRELFLDAQPVLVSTSMVIPDVTFKMMAVPVELAGMTQAERSEGSNASQKGRFREIVRQSLVSMLVPLDMITPITTYRTNNSAGIEIASLIRIGTNEKTN